MSEISKKFLKNNYHTNLSIIIPTYNSEKYLSNALRSILDQDVDKVEIIVVDGDSKDKTLSILNTFSEHLNIRIFKIGKSSIGYARNVGLQKAQGILISFLDADDFYLPYRLSWAIKSLDNDKYDAVFTNFLHFDPESNKLWKPREYRGNLDIKHEIFFQSLINLSTITVKKNFLTSNYVEFEKGIRGRFGEDWDFIGKLIINKCRFLFTNIPLSVVVINNESHSTINRQWKMKVSTMISLLNIYKKIGLEVIASRDGMRLWLYKTILIMTLSGRGKLSRKVINSVTKNSGGKLFPFTIHYLGIFFSKFAGKLPLVLLLNMYSNRIPNNKKYTASSVDISYINKFFRLN